MSFLKRKIFPFLKKAKLGLVSVFNKLFRRKKNNLSSNQLELDRKLVHSLSRSQIPNLKQLAYLNKFLSKKEAWVIRALVLVILLNLTFLGFNFYRNNFEVVPRRGGEYTEGLVGNPQYINPLYNLASDVDKDISSLVFSSLFRFSDKETLKKDLVSDYSVCEDKKTYTVKLRDDALWHHDERLTAEDVLFTFEAIKNPEYDSLLRSRFSGVDVKQEDDYTLVFSLEEADPGFLSLLTFGILPADLWSQATPQTSKLTELNLKPIGSGPYQFKRLAKNRQGNILSYTLELNENYYSQKPLIEEITFNFFTSSAGAIEALNRNEVDGLGYLPPGREVDLVAKNSLDIHHFNLPQVNYLFFNHNLNEILEEEKTRKVLSLSINKDKIVSEVFGDDSERVFSFLPPYARSYHPELDRYDFNLERTRELLEELEWEKLEISTEEIEELIKIQEKIDAVEETGDSDSEEGEEEEDDQEEKPELTEEQRVKMSIGPGEWLVKATSSRESEDLTFQDFFLVELTTPAEERSMEVARRVKNYWEKIGIKTEIREVSPGDIHSQVVTPRDFEIFLYAQNFGIKPDFYSFWHSSEIEEGLNIVAYSNEELDEILEDSSYLDWDSDERIDKYKKIQEILNQDLPSLPLYSPRYTYVQNGTVKGVELEYIVSPSDRFSQIEDWYIKTGKRIVW